MIYTTIEELLDRILELEKENRELILELGEIEKKLFIATAKLVNLQHKDVMIRLAKYEQE